MKRVVHCDGETAVWKIIFRFYGPSHCYGSFGFRLARTLHK